MSRMSLGTKVFNGVKAAIAWKSPLTSTHCYIIRSIIRWPGIHPSALMQVHGHGCCSSCWWDEMTSLNCGHQQAYCSSPRWYMRMESRGGMMFIRENRRTRIKPVPVPLCPPQMPHWLTRARTQVSAVRDRRLTAWATAYLLWRDKFNFLINSIALDTVNLKMLRQSKVRW
jgi:hypothetical protein